MRVELILQTLAHCSWLSRWLSLSVDLLRVRGSSLASRPYFRTWEWICPDRTITRTPHTFFRACAAADAQYCRNKAVAEGAVSFFLTHCVAARVARFTYGANCATGYMPSDPDHALRAAQVFSRPSGRLVIPGAFDVILAKVCSYSMTYLYGPLAYSQ